MGSNFCNRTQERARVKHNIETSRATLIMSPRRYGKTSLVLEVLQELKLPYAHIDLFSEINEEEVQNTILGVIGDVLYTCESTPQKALKFLSNFFSDLNISFKFNKTQIKVEFSKPKKASAKTILNLLQKFDDVLKTKNKKAILFFDEFQRVCQITDSAAIEGALRHIAQASKNITFIFSGSNRNLLTKMFDDRTKPLYKLCDRLILERIAREHYIPFIKDKAVKKWGKEISQDAIDAILDITEQHPYYVNVLCHKSWLHPLPPGANSIEEQWYKYAQEERNNVINEINLLSINQAKMLISIAKYGERFSPMSKDFFAVTRFSPSSAAQAIKSLEKMDYISLGENNMYQIVDPLIKYVFSR